MEDEVFIAGDLDTDFISAFNKRKKEKETDETTRDMAIIACALAYADKKAMGKRDTANPEHGPSRWAFEGRIAGHRNRF